MWWDEDAGLLASLWVRKNGANSTNNMIAFNEFVRNEVGVRLRKSNVHVFGNSIRHSGQDIDWDEASIINDHEELPHRFETPYIEVFGVNNGSPVHRWAFRKGWREMGRDQIIMTEWGPWDHDSPLLQFVQRTDHDDEYRLLNSSLRSVDHVFVQGQVFADLKHDRLLIRPLLKDTLASYRFTFHHWLDGQFGAKGVLTGGVWTVRTITSPVDPREDAERWKRESKELHQTTCDPLHLPFGAGGMAQARGLSVQLPQDHFGTIATRSLTFPLGKWRIKTVSDDGIRVWLDDKLVIDDWTWHPPKEHVYEFDIEQPRKIEMRVEHFELDGHAILTLDIEQAQ